MFNSGIDKIFTFLLPRVIILEDELEKFAGSKESQEQILEAYQIAEKKLNLIQPHMQASNSCWEEAIAQVEKMVRRNPDKKCMLTLHFITYVMSISEMTWWDL